MIKSQLKKFEKRMTKKDRLLELLAKEDEMILNQAYIYAKTLICLGVDVSKKWETLTQQSEALNKAYLQGCYDEREYLLQADERRRR